METEYLGFLDEIGEAYFFVQDQRIVAYNRRMTELSGYDKHELIGQPFIITIAPDLRDHVIEMHQSRLSGQKTPQYYDTLIVHKDGTHVPVKVSTWLTEYQGRAAVAGVLVDNSRCDSNLKALDSLRKRIARELHDTTMQELSFVCRNLEDLATGVYGAMPDPAQECLLETRAVVARNIKDLRRVTQGLRAQTLDGLKLPDALRCLSEQWTGHNGLTISVTVLGEEKGLPSDIELELFRISQEAVNNVRKHAEATLTTIILEYDDCELRLSVEDNGKGFEPTDRYDDLALQGRLGLTIIAERVRMLGARHHIVSEPGKGTKIKVALPT